MSEVPDPGHLLAKFRPSGPAGSRRLKRFDFSLETCLGPTIFHRTKVITVTPRYVLFNNSSEPLQFGQHQTNMVWQVRRHDSIASAISPHQSPSVPSQWWTETFKAD